METFFITGFEGSGKKTIASLLSSRRNVEYIDIEKLIEQEEKTSSYNIQKLKGNEYYNDKIYNIISKIPASDFVVSTTTFTPTNEKNSNLMLRKGKVIYLKANAKTIINHTKNNIENYQLLKDNFDEEHISSMINNLNDKYVNSASYTICIDKKNINEIINEIIYYQYTINMLNCHIHIK